MGRRKKSYTSGTDSAGDVTETEKPEESKPVKKSNPCKGCKFESIKSARYCGSCVIYRS